MKKIVSILAALFFIGMAGFAQEAGTSNDAVAISTRKNHLELSSTVNFANYFKSDYKTGSTHFAPVTGFNDGVGLLGVFNANYVIPFGDPNNFLFSGNNVTLRPMFELTPVSVGTGFGVSVKPIAVLEFTAGARISTGWSFVGSDGLAYYNPAENDYEQADPFKTWHYKFYGGATFMFDFEAVFPGKWHHVVTLVNYEIAYNGGINKPTFEAGGQSFNGEIFRFQREFGNTDGLRQKFNFLLGYQMPFMVSMVGLAFGFNGYLATTGLGEIYDGYNAKFTSYFFTPLTQIDITKKDKLSVAMNFATRRSFKEEHEKISVEPGLTECGSEWFFDYIALSWTHKF